MAPRSKKGNSWDDVWTTILLAAGCITFGSVVCHKVISARMPQAPRPASSWSWAFVREGHGGVTFFRVQPRGASFQQRPGRPHGFATLELSSGTQTLHAAAAATPLLGSAVLVRTYAPTMAQSERISQWFASLKNSGAEMFVSLDQTKPENDGAAAAFLDRLVDAGFQVDSESVHRCKEEDMLRNYPALAKHNRIMWNYHTQGIDLWLQAHLANKKNHEPAYIWILEDDLGYTG
eukprot:CAMPEP_0168496240 /NCGR_PEP_ID=MMETSP0228-20121227/72160_1 /TAXON_ID=133427 /ORGANISM="Protoceratium reticulatum, Strain CCCM 535 (=CCMP 1889)" /LENGTH=233 /DNA_ID=CAMNT_0008513103 /DNA_START=36 /DNA_END=734 /DNA_ORIENTATION=+